MIIQSPSAPVYSAKPNAVAVQNQESEPKPELRIKSDQYDRADRYNDSRAFGNYTSAALTGAAIETVDATVKSLPLAGSIVKNLWKAETIGPNLKVLGTLAALPGAGLSIVAAPFAGAGKGASAARKSMRADSEPLTKDTSNQVTELRFPKGEPSQSMSSKFMRELNEFGNKKLEDGEKPFDVPILSPIFSLAGGVVSGVISGVAGAVVGLTAGTLTGVKEFGRSVMDTEKSVGERAIRATISVFTPVVMGGSLAWSGMKESVPRGFVDGWNSGPVKPIVDTVKSTGVIAGAVFKEAWER